MARYARGWFAVEMILLPSRKSDPGFLSALLAGLLLLLLLLLLTFSLPTASAQEQEQQDKSGEATIDEPTWTTYRHPTGVHLDHPSDWRAQPIDAGIALIPPDFDQNQELILVIGEAAEGLASPRDPQVGQYFDQLVSQISPTLSRSGQAVDGTNRAGESARYDYKGTLGNGQQGIARFDASIVGPYAIAVAMIATDARAAKREATFNRIAASLGQDKPQRDPALVGTWQGSENDTNTDVAGGSSTILQSNKTYTLAADGRIAGREKTYVGISSGGISGQSSDESHSAGTWSAAEGRIFIAWDDGTAASGTYKLEGDTLTIQFEGGKPQTLRHPS